ncbi:MAG: hypothetical protein FWC77_00115 [Defluviitaleaceae bacterium]|nr:hypothetical protein [Defluviitaleaceae bacterium]
MPYCPKCKDEFREGFASCNICDTTLVDELHSNEEQTKPEEPEDFVMVDDVPALLCNVSNNIEAGMIEAMLGSYNIPVMKRWRYGGDVMMIYTGASSTGADLYVPSKLLEDAKALLLSNPVTEEADDPDDEEFQEYARQQEAEKRLKMRKLLVWTILTLVFIVAFALVWWFYTAI